MLRPKDVLFGEIAVTLKLLTSEQLAECITVQRRDRRHRRLGAICEQLGYLLSADVQRVLDQQARLVGQRGGRRLG